MKFCQERFKESSSLLNYGFANFTNKKLIDKQSKIATIEVLHSKDKNIDVFAKEDFFVVDKKGNNSEYQCNVTINEDIVAPISKSQCVGKVIITKNGKVITEIDIVTNIDINKITYFETIKKVVENW